MFVADGREVFKVLEDVVVDADDLLETFLLVEALGLELSVDGLCQDEVSLDCLVDLLTLEVQLQQLEVLFSSLLLLGLFVDL